MQMNTDQHKFCFLSLAQRVLLLSLPLLLVACGATETAPVPTLLPTSAPIAAGSCGLNVEANSDGDTDEAAIRAVIAAEGSFVVSQEIDRLMALWGESSTVADAEHTPNDDADDQTWQGRDAIRNRYVRMVFPGAPSAAEATDLVITRDDPARAVVQATTQIGGEVSPGGDLWVVAKEDECWVLESLTYNLEPQ